VTSNRKMAQTSTRTRTDSYRDNQEPPYRRWSRRIAERLFRPDPRPRAPRRSRSPDPRRPEQRSAHRRARGGNAWRQRGQAAPPPRRGGGRPAQHRLLPATAGIDRRHGGRDAKACRSRPFRRWRTGRERAGQAGRLSQCGGRPAHCYARPRDAPGIALRASGRRRHLGGAHHRHPLRSARPDHRAGHGEHL